MKLRIEDDTLRLRLSEAEVRDFAQTGRVAATVHFGSGEGQHLTYALERGSQPTETPVQVHFEAGSLTVLVPFGLAKTWVESEQNGFTHDLPLATGQPLRIL